MCDLCNPEFREPAKREMLLVADNLERLAAQYRDMAEGRLKPHSNPALDVASRAKSVIHALVKEWI